MNKVTKEGGGGEGGCERTKGRRGRKDNKTPLHFLSLSWRGRDREERKKMRKNKQQWWQVSERNKVPWKIGS
jgi:hypothetical protein